MNSVKSVIVFFVDAVNKTMNISLNRSYFDARTVDWPQVLCLTAFFGDDCIPVTSIIVTGTRIQIHSLAFSCELLLLLRFQYCFYFVSFELFIFISTTLYLSTFLFSLSSPTFCSKKTKDDIWSVTRVFKLRLRHECPAHDLMQWNATKNCCTTASS